LLFKVKKLFTYSEKLYGSLMKMPFMGHSLSVTSTVTLMATTLGAFSAKGAVIFYDGNATFVEVNGANTDLKEVSIDAEGHASFIFGFSTPKGDVFDAKDAVASIPAAGYSPIFYTNSQNGLPLIPEGTLLDDQFFSSYGLDVNSSAPFAWFNEESGDIFGEWRDGSDGYVAVRFQKPGSADYYYGWAHFTYEQHGAYGKLSYLGGAYESEAGKYISTPGQIPEPGMGAMALMALGAGGLIARRRYLKAYA